MHVGHIVKLVNRRSPLCIKRDSLTSIAGRGCIVRTVSVGCAATIGGSIPAVKYVAAANKGIAGKCL